MSLDNLSFIIFSLWLSYFYFSLSANNFICSCAISSYYLFSWLSSTALSFFIFIYFSNSSLINLFLSASLTAAKKTCTHTLSLSLLWNPACGFLQHHFLFIVAGIAVVVVAIVVNVVVVVDIVVADVVGENLNREIKV